MGSDRQDILSWRPSTRRPWRVAPIRKAKAWRNLFMPPAASARPERASPKRSSSKLAQSVEETRRATEGQFITLPGNQALRGTLAVRLGRFAMDGDSSDSPNHGRFVEPAPPSATSVPGPHSGARSPGRVMNRAAPNQGLVLTSIGRPIRQIDSNRHIVSTENSASTKKPGNGRAFP